MLSPSKLVLLQVLACLFAVVHGLDCEECFAGEDPPDSLLQPFLQTNCIECHHGPDSEAKLDLGAFQSRASFERRFAQWKEIERRVSDGTMPPKDATPRPSEKERLEFIVRLRLIRKEETIRLAGDPGSLVVRRLSNAEFDYTIRDLTGVDIRPAREFPVDPANEAGFDNSGESLTMSSALLRKYLSAARLVASHLVLTPTGIAFAPYPVATDTDRDKYCVQRVVDFYRKQPTDIGEYLFGAWKLKCDTKLGRGSSIDSIAKSLQLSPRYLAFLIEHLDATKVDTKSEPDTSFTPTGPMSEVLRRWHEISTDASQERKAQETCQRLGQFVRDVRRQLEPQFNMRLKGVHDGAQAFVLWKNEQSAKHRRIFVRETLDSIDRDKLSAQVSDALEIPADATKKEALFGDLEHFCNVFPDAFYVAERGRDYLGVPKEKQEKGRLLSAGFHSMMGYFRDDIPLCELILDDAGRRELDGLWQELDFVTAAPLRQYQGFLWFERTDHKYLRDPEFDFARPESKESLSHDMIVKLSELYLDKAKNIGGQEEQLQAMRNYFTNMDTQIRWVEATRKSTEVIHLQAIERFAQRAFRGCASLEEQPSWKELYRRLRETEQLTHEEAIQDLLVTILMSPEFCYRVDLKAEGGARRPLSDVELANRMSYFLWSSLPDDRLLDFTKRGELRSHDRLLAEVDRMLDDEKVNRLATEFGSQWLDFRRFQEHNSVDRKRFPQFTDSLRDAMYQEPIRFLKDMIQSNGSVWSCIEGQHTFVNSELAAHYGINEPNDPKLNPWWKVEDATPFGRGGLLPMSVFMTQNAPGLRTSPVKRGYWVVRRLLGEPIPPPPPNVPELPADESLLGELTLRQTLEKHRKLEACAVCHDRFDSIGLVFESYGPIGEKREQDLGGKPIDASAVFPSGLEGAGLTGLQAYLQQHRKEDFIENLCRKLLTFALGRTLILSDDLLIQKMRENLKEENYQFRSLVRTIVLSQPFLEKRGIEGSLGQ